MAAPLVSIVTPSYNQAQFLNETIVSVLEQDYPNLEYVVVDDGSTDGSIEIARRYEDRLDYFAVQPNAGQVAALNHGFSKTTGELLGWLNSDDVLLPGAIARVAAEFERDPELLLVYGDNVFIDAEGREFAALPAREWDPAAMVAHCENHVPQPGVLFRRRALELAPMNEGGYYFFDFELWLRLAPHGRVARLGPPPLAGYRFHAESKSAGAPIRKAEDYIRLADEFFATPMLPTELQQQADAGRRTAYTRAAEYFYEGLDLRRARTFALRARAFPLLLRTLLPPRVVRALRARRRPASAAQSAPS